MEFSTMVEMLGWGFLTSLQIFCLTLVGALPLGLVVAFGRMSRFKPLSLFVQFYIHPLGNGYFDCFLLRKKRFR